MAKAPAKKPTAAQAAKDRADKLEIMLKQYEMLNARANLVEAKVRIAEAQAKLKKLK